jgi:hypothetical protein
MVQDTANGTFSGYVTTNYDKQVGGIWQKYGVGSSKMLTTSSQKMNPKNLKTSVGGLTVNYGWYHLFDRRCDRKTSCWKTVDDKNVTSIKLNLNFKTAKTIKQFLMVAASSENALVDKCTITNMPMSWTVRGSNAASPDPDLSSDWTLIQDFTGVDGIVGSNKVNDYGNGFLETQEHSRTLNNTTAYNWYQFEFTKWNGMNTKKCGMELGKLELYAEDVTQTVNVDPLNILPNFKLKRQCGLVTAANDTGQLVDDGNVKISINIDSQANRLLSMISDRLMISDNNEEWFNPPTTPKDKPAPELTIEFANPIIINKYCIVQSELSVGRNMRQWELYGIDTNNVSTLLQTVTVSPNVSQFAFADDINPTVNNTITNDYHYPIYIMNDVLFNNTINSNNDVLRYKKYKFIIKATDVLPSEKNKYSPSALSLGEIRMYTGIVNPPTPPVNPPDLLSGTMFEARLFYDKIEYGSTDPGTVSIDFTNTQDNPAIENISVNGNMNIYWKDGVWNMPDGGTSTMFNVSASSSLPLNDNLEHIGSRGDVVSFPVASGDDVYFYFKSLSGTMVNQTGSLDLEYFIK